MPDEILCRILSSVTTKEVVATSVLSKRWTHLWLSVPNLHFPSIKVDDIESHYHFIESVYSVLVSRDANASNFINSFRLSVQFGNTHLAYNLGFPHIIKWLNLVVKPARKLNHLYLHLDVEDHYDNRHFFDYSKLPTTIFTCKTLVTLDLCRFTINVKDSSTGFAFPSLKTLSLHLIHFNQIRDFLLLLAGSPILEDLRLSRIDIGNYRDIHLNLQEFKRLSLPKLTKANIYQCLLSYSRYMVIAVSTSVSLCVDASALYYNKDYKVRSVTNNYMYRHIHMWLLHSNNFIFSN